MNPLFQHSITFRTSLVLFLALFAIGCQSPKDNTLRIAAAANLRFCLPHIAEEFKLVSGQECELIFASSGKLCAQIEAGAPFDLFISADKEYPEHLHDLRLASVPSVYARGRLALWSATLPASELMAVLMDSKGPKIAIADSTLAPYGKAAHQYIKVNKLGEMLKSRLVIGESVSQVNQFITSRAASMGFTSLSTVVSNPDAGRGHVELDIDDYAPIEQCAVVLSQSELPEMARAFLTFLKSDSVQQKLRDYGYYPVNTRFEHQAD